MLATLLCIMSHYTTVGHYSVNNLISIESSNDDSHSPGRTTRVRTMGWDNIISKMYTNSAITKNEQQVTQPQYTARSKDSANMHGMSVGSRPSTQYAHMPPWHHD